MSYSVRTLIVTTAGSTGRESEAKPGFGPGNDPFTDQKHHLETALDNACFDLFLLYPKACHYEVLNHAQVHIFMITSGNMRSPLHGLQSSSLGNSMLT